MTDNDIHVLPINDLRDHTEERDCWCEPAFEDGVVIHNSMDRREHTIEKGRTQ